MPLSEEELRLLEQMERALVAEDPKFVSALRGTTHRRTARRRALIAGGVFVVGVVVMMAGAITQTTLVGILGFVVMLGSAVLCLKYWRSQNVPVAEPAATADVPAEGFGLTVVEGGKKQRRQRAPKQSKGSMMERFEERWRRRRGSNGF